MDVISFPFRIDATGTIATVEQDSDECAAEQIAALLLTRIGERPLSAEFGVTDMAGQGLDASELAAAVATFGPDVTLQDIAVDEVGDGVQRVAVTFE